MQFNKQTGPKPHFLLIREASKIANNEHEHMIAAMAMRANGVSTDELKACFGRSYTSKLLELGYRNNVKAVMLADNTRVKLIVTK